jgi:phosphoribosylaminoimidazole carboxylase
MASDSTPLLATGESPFGIHAESKIVACLGGGQLGRMMGLEAPRLNLHMHFLESASDCPAAVAGSITVGSIQTKQDIQRFVDECQPDVLTTEIEHVNCEALIQLEEEKGVNVQPSGKVIQLIQDKFMQKEHFRQAGIPVAPYQQCTSRSEIQQAGDQLGWPIMLKARKGAYDGRGNAVVKSATEIEAALAQLGVQQEHEDASLDLYVEGWIEFSSEIAVIVVRSSTPSVYATKSYPAVTAIQDSSICRIVLAPARGISKHVNDAAKKLATQAIDSLPKGASGVFGVEMFVTADHNILLNEVAPRPHNTGHYTQDACVCSQFENHLRAIAGMPLGSTELTTTAAAMVNVLGQETMEETMKSSNEAMRSMPGASVHWYGKTGCRKGRKMGHINLVGDMESSIDKNVETLLRLEGLPGEIFSRKACPIVGVIMGSQSDLPTMHAAVDVLKKFSVPYEVDIVSAHRTPEKLMVYSREAAARGIQVIIAGAGGAAHLPGMVASLTPLPVIGVPVKTATLSGVDSLYSIVQMPNGIPVATVAIGNAQNAGLLAVRILASSRPDLQRLMKQYQSELKEMVEETSARLLELGSDEYMNQMEHKNKSVNV